MGSASSGAPDGVCLKKTKRRPGKADAQAQRAFVEEYRTFRAKLPSDQAVGFLDESGFEHNSRPARCLIRKGAEKYLSSNSGYKRLNALGCVILEDLEVDVVYTEGTINAALVKAYLEALEAKLSCEKLHLFVDNASFHKALEEESFEKIELHFLPTYAPNLNLCERIWGFSKKELLDNQYYATFPEFHEAFCTFKVDPIVKTKR